MTAVPVVAPPAGVTSRPRQGRRFNLGSLPTHIVIVALMVIWLIPTIGLLVNSFRSQQDAVTTGWWTALFPPSNLSTDNYAYVLAQNGLGAAFVNSLFITIPATIIPIFVAAFAAYAFSWMSFPGRDVLFVVVVGLLVVPLQSTFIPILGLYKNFGLNGQFLALWLAHTGYGLPFAVFVLRNFMGELPKEVFESASIDGAGHATRFFRLALPMSIPAVAALAIFQFLFVWNDLLVALIYIGSNVSNQPLTQVTAGLVSSFGNGANFLAAAAFISMALPLVVFALLQRYFVRGLTGGAVKG